MRFFTETVALHSALPPDVLLDRVRALAAGHLQMPPQSSWRAPVRWSLRELPDGIRLTPLSPPFYREQPPCFIGTIAADGSGSSAKGRVQPYALTTWITAFIVSMVGVMSTAGIMQQLSRHSSRGAMLIALVGTAIGAAGIAMLRFSVSFAVVPIRRLLETAASSDARAIEKRTPQAGALVPKRGDQSTRSVIVVRSAGAVDGLFALFLLTTDVVSSRIGRPLTMLIAAVLASGSSVLFVLASRLSKR